jgi:hypothetical protein
MGIRNFRPWRTVGSILWTILEKSKICTNHRMRQEHGFLKNKEYRIHTRRFWSFLVLASTLLLLLSKEVSAVLTCKKYVQGTERVLFRQPWALSLLFVLCSFGSRTIMAVVAVAILLRKRSFIRSELMLQFNRSQLFHTK